MDKWETWIDLFSMRKSVVLLLAAACALRMFFWPSGGLIIEQRPHSRTITPPPAPLTELPPNSRPSAAPAPLTWSPTLATAETEAESPPPPSITFPAQSSPPPPLPQSLPPSPLLPPTLSEARPATDAESSSLEASEAAYVECCAANWQHHWRDKRLQLCKRDGGDSSDLGGGAEASGDGGSGTGRLWCDVASSDTGDAAWFCEARGLVVNSSAIGLGSEDVSVPTPAQKGTWGRRALLLPCVLRTESLHKRKLFRMLLAHVFPAALAAATPAALANAHSAPDALPKAGADGVLHRPRVVVFVVRYSVKNFWLAHYDLLQLTAVLLRAIGPNFAAVSQLVFVPPDKANHAHWGAQLALWRALTDAPPLSYVEWIRLTAQKHAAPTDEPRPLVRIERTVFAISGLHSVYGRGTIGHAIEAACMTCGRPRATAVKTTAASPVQMAMARERTRSGRYDGTSAFYRVFLSHALRRLGHLVPPPLDGRALPALWIRRGKGVGGGYSLRVGRRCLNEEELLQARTGGLVGVGVGCD
mgnify:CR=1 FL=1